VGNGGRREETEEASSRAEQESGPGRRRTTHHRLPGWAYLSVSYENLAGKVGLLGLISMGQVILGCGLPLMVGSFHSCINCRPARCLLFLCGDRRETERHPAQLRMRKNIACEKWPHCIDQSSSTGTADDVKASARAPEAIVGTWAVGIDRRFFCRSTVDSFVDQPSEMNTCEKITKQCNWRVGLRCERLSSLFCFLSLLLCKEYK
jgi:hypothetical protein